MSKEAIRLARNLIKVGIVNSVNPEKGSVDVLFEDKDRAIFDDLPMLNFEYNLPDVGDQVLCVFLGNGLENGFCLGGFYSEVFKPPTTNKEIYMKKLDDSTSIQYDKSTKTLKVSSTNPVTLEGDFIIHGNLTVYGNVNATGTITGIG